MGFACVVDGWRVVERSIDDKRQRRNSFAGELLRGFRTAKVEHFVEYRLRVNGASDRWTIHHRFEDFRKLNLEVIGLELRSAEPRPLATFPRRTLWSSMDPHFLETRMLALGDYLAELCQDELIGSSEILFDFLVPGVDLQDKRSIIASDDAKDGSLISFFLTMEVPPQHEKDAAVRWHEARDASTAFMTTTSTTAPESGYPATTVSFFSSCATVADSKCSVIAPPSAIARAASPCHSSLINESSVTKPPAPCHDIHSQANLDNNSPSSYLGALLARMRGIEA